MPKFRKGTKRRKRHGPVGAPPGTLDIDPNATASKVSVIAYGPESVTERPVPTDALAELRGSAPVVWVNVDGLGDPEVMHAVRSAFGIHPLALEDVVHVQHRPKVEAYAENLFIVVPMLREGAEDHGISTEQIAIFLGRDFVLTFQEQQGDCLEPVRNRLRKGLGRIRTAGPDFLAYALVDTIVDRYFPRVEEHVSELEHLEDDVLTGDTPNVNVRVHEMRQRLRQLRRVVVPLHTSVSSLLREPTELISADTRVYLRDCHDHAVQLMEAVESARDAAVGLMDLHLSIANQRMSEVMKVLTIIATIFIPLSFVVGLYGMNFDRASPWNLPELGWRYGYPAALVLMACIVGGLLAFFRKRGWLGNPRRTDED